MSDNPSDQEKAKALEDIYYEIQQLYRLISPPTYPPCASLQNAWLEAILVHVRALLYFYKYPLNERREDDVLAEDYGFKACQIYNDDSYRIRLNKDLAHITYSRTNRSPSDKGWPLMLIVPPILTRCEIFMSHMMSRFPPGSRDDLKRDWQLLYDQIKAKNKQGFPDTVRSTSTSPF